MDLVDVRDLLAEPGASRQLALDQRFVDLRTELATVSPEFPLHMEILLESVVEGILASGPLSGRMAYRCARCLKDFSEGFRVEVRELFAHGVSADDDEYPIREGHIDLEPMIRDAVLLSIPFSPLCRPDCQGLCPRCGGDRNLGECSCGPEVDPRWSELDRLDLR
jgi:uncharacterized protein